MAELALDVAGTPVSGTKLVHPFQALDTEAGGIVVHYRLLRQIQTIPLRIVSRGNRHPTRERAMSLGIHVACSRVVNQSECPDSFVHFQQAVRDRIRNSLIPPKFRYGKRIGDQRPPHK